jgi:hypothetical protein
LPWLSWNINNPNSLLSKAHLTNLNLNNFKTIEAMETTNRFKSYYGVSLNHLRSLRVHHFGILEAARLKKMASSLPSMASTVCQI